MHLVKSIDMFYIYGDTGIFMDREEMEKCNKMAQNLEAKGWIS
jgi:hypothetical protein